MDRNATTRRRFLRDVGVGIGALTAGSFARGDERTLAAGRSPGSTPSTARPNVMLITADDLNWDSVGFMGCPLPGITPNLDRLASQGTVFEHGYVNTTVCMPSRHTMLTGRMPGTAGDFGDFHPLDDDVPTLPEMLKDAGYLTGVIGKAWHMWPPEKFGWDFYFGGGHSTPNETNWGRDPDAFGKLVREAVDASQAQARPYFLVVNSHDPHRVGSVWRETTDREDYADVPITATYRPADVPVPPFLPDLPEVRDELACYFNAVHRLDVTVGAVLRVLEQTGTADNTCVCFMSDHGMPFWFAKQDVYRHGARVPMVIRWPGRVPTGVRLSEPMVSAVDYAPTILDALGLPPISGAHGRSFLPLLRGASQAGRDHVYVVRMGGFRIARALAATLTKRYQYVFNPWSVTGEAAEDGTTYPSYAAIQQAAETDPAVAHRLTMMHHRPIEEFYDDAVDPGSRHNLIDIGPYQPTIAEHRQRLLADLTTYAPQMGEALANRHDPDHLARYMAWYSQQRSDMLRHRREWQRAYRQRSGLGS